MGRSMRKTRSRTKLSDQNEAEKMMAEARQAMVDQIRDYGLFDEQVLSVMAKIRRHVFLPPEESMPTISYGDFPHPIGFGATISQPFIVAYMTHRLKLRPGERVLEIGTGSGYQAAVLAALGAKVWSLEIVPELAARAEVVLSQEGFRDVRVRCASGYAGWAEHAPFDAIIATCAPPEIPDELVAQLVDGGRMILPVGRCPDSQQLVMIRREGEQLVSQDDLPVRFVPMV